MAATAAEEEGSSVFGLMLHAARDRLAISRARFAAAAGMSARRLDDIEKGRVKPTPEVRKHLLTTLERLFESPRVPGFGVALRQERQQRELSVPELARRAGVPIAMVEEIESGTAQPGERARALLLAALRDNRHPDLPRQTPQPSASSQNRHLAQHRYELQDTVVRDRGREVRGLTGGRMGARLVSQAGKPDPLLISTPVDFVEMLGAVHVWAGAPSMRQLEIESGGALKRSTISDALNVERVRKLGKIPSLEWCRTFLQACGIRGTEDWVYAWRRLKALERPQAGKWLQG